MNGEANLGALILNYEFHFLLGQVKLFVSSEEEDIPEKKIILREKDWLLCKKMVKNALRSRTEQAESVSAMWKSDSTDEESVYFRVFCALRDRDMTSSVTFTRQIGEQEGDKDQQISFPYALWRRLEENQGDRIEHLFKRSKMYLSVVKVNRCIFPSLNGDDVEIGDTSRDDDEEILGGGAVSSI